MFFGSEDNPKNLLCKLPKFDSYVDALNSYSSVDVIVEAAISLIWAGQSGIFNVACDDVASVYEVASWIGCNGKKITDKELIDKEKLYLVNNTMCLKKLKLFYQPPKLKDEILRCYEEIKKIQSDSGKNQEHI